MNLVLLCAASLAFTLGGVCMKLSHGLTRPGPAAMVFLLFGAGAAAQGFAMRHSEMGVAYVFVVGLEAILAFAFSVFLFQESAGWSRVGAVGLITAGLVLLHR